MKEKDSFAPVRPIGYFHSNFCLGGGYPANDAMSRYAALLRLEIQECRADWMSKTIEREKRADEKGPLLVTSASGAVNKAGGIRSCGLYSRATGIHD